MHTVMASIMNCAAFEQGKPELAYLRGAIAVFGICMCLSRAGALLCASAVGSLVLFLHGMSWARVIITAARLHQS